MEDTETPIEKIASLLNQLIEDFPETKQLFEMDVLADLNQHNIGQKYIYLRPANGNYEDDDDDDDPDQEWLITITGIITAIGRLFDDENRIASMYNSNTQEFQGFAVIKEVGIVYKPKS
jgi:hypothetical protein